MVEAHDSTGVKWRAVWGSGVNELLAFDGQTTRYIPAQDARNSIVALWSVGGEELVDIHSYDAHGRLETALQYEEQIVCSEIFDPQGGADGPPCIPLESSIPFAFNGAWRSPTTGIYYMRNRWYAPQLFQFLTPDPKEFIDSTNVYAFAAFDPINYWDPYGLDSSFMKGWERAGLDMLKETANLVAEGVRRGPSGGGVVGAAGDRLATGVRSAYREGGWSAVDDMLNPFTNLARSMGDFRQAVDHGTNADVGEAAANSMLSFAAVLGTMGSAARANRIGKDRDGPDMDTMGPDNYTANFDPVEHRKRQTVIGDDQVTKRVAGNVASEPGYHDVIIHGDIYDDAGSIFFPSKKPGTPTHSQQIADAISGNPNYNGEQLRLVTCYGGCGPAGELADIMKTNVVGATSRVGVRNMPNAPAIALDGGYWKVYAPDGSWNPFSGTATK